MTKLFGHLGLVTYWLPEFSLQLLRDLVVVWDAVGVDFRLLNDLQLDLRLRKISSMPSACVFRFPFSANK